VVYPIAQLALELKIAGPMTAPESPAKKELKMSDDAAKTGTNDVTYNLTSILYHALQGAQAYDQYIRDAERDGKQDLAEFFREVQRQDRARAERAKELLAQDVRKS
jgi:hypothetical protein